MARLVGSTLASFVLLRVLLQRACYLDARLARQLVSLIHGVTSLTIAAHVVLVDGYAPRLANTPLHELMLAYSIGYFVVDTVGMCTIDPFSASYSMHHAGVVLCMGCVQRMGFGANTIACALLVGEVSNPLGRSQAIYLQHHNPPSTDPHRGTLRRLYQGTFVGARCLLMPWLIWALHRDLAPALSWPEYLGYFGSIGAVALGSLAWSAQMVRRMVGGA